MASGLESPEAAKARGDDEAYRFGRPPEDLPALDPGPGSRERDASGIEIQVLDFRTARDRARFLDSIPPLYAGDSNYIAPLRMHFMRFLDPSKNPAFANLEVRPMLALKDGKVVGRITAHIDRAYDEYHDTKSSAFGFFESINDPKVAHTLLREATTWAQEQGAIEMFGPMNFTMSHQVGMLVENFDRPPYVEELYNPPFYPDLMTSFGFAKAKDWWVWMIDVREGNASKNRQRVARIADRVKKREGITLRHLNLKDPDGEIERLYDLYMAAWQKNWSFVPLSKEEFTWLAQDLKFVAIPELVLFVEVEGRPVGFCATLPNINEVMPKNGRLFPFGWWKVFTQRKKTKTGRLYTLGVVPEYRKRGLESMMFSETVVASQRAGFTHGEIGMTLEDNDLINRAIESMDGALDRKYRIYGIDLTGPDAT